MSKKAFTLVELMIVIAIIGILAAALFPSMTGYIQRSRDRASSANITTLSKVLFNFLTDRGSFSGMIQDQWYCVPLSDVQSGSCTHPILPDLPQLYLKKRDFSIQSDSYPVPLFEYTGSGGDPHALRLTNNNSAGKYILHWTLPGDGGYGATAIEPTDSPVATSRCSPGQVRWINTGSTACHMLIQ